MPQAPIQSVTGAARGAFKFEGQKEILANLARVLDAPSGKKAKETYYKAGKILVEQAKANAPVRTGRLRSAIFVGWGDPAKPNVLVGVNYKIAPHAHLVEYDPNKQPYMRPAITQTKERIKNTIYYGLQEAIAASLKK